MAFQVNLPNEEAWAKEIATSQSGVVQGVHFCVTLDLLKSCDIDIANSVCTAIQSSRCIKTGVGPARQ